MGFKRYFFAGIVFLILLVGFETSFVFSQCGGLPDCDFDFPPDCKAQCGCKWNGGNCRVAGCGDCGVEGQCLASGCSWTVIPPVDDGTGDDGTGDDGTGDDGTGDDGTGDDGTGDDGTGDDGTGDDGTGDDGTGDDGTGDDGTDDDGTGDDGTGNNQATGSSGSSSTVYVDLIVDEPNSFVSLPNGEYSLITRGFENGDLSSGLEVYSFSDLFGAVQLQHNYDLLGKGHYGGTVYFYNMPEDTYDVTFRAVNSDMSKDKIMKINLNPNIYFDFGLSSGYEKGKRIIFDGFLETILEERVRDAIVEISFESGDFSYSVNTTSDYLGRVYYEYLISFAEPAGEWKVVIDAEDEYGNVGHEEFFINVTSPPNTEYYSVVFQSPIEDSVVSRGDTVPISVKVFDEDELVENAQVAFKDPEGELVYLDEKSPGVYATDYELSEGVEVGDWNLFMQAVNDESGFVKAGGNQIELAVDEAKLTISELSPNAHNFFTGQNVEFSAEVEYSNGDSLDNSLVYAYLGNKKIRLKSEGNGVYSSEYLILPEDSEEVTVSFYATDVYGNDYLSAPRMIEVEELSGIELQLRLFYYGFLLKYMYIIIISILGTILITQPLWHNVQLRITRRKAENNYTQNVENQKDLQRKYFKNHLISRDAYDNLMMKYKEKESDLKDKIGALNKKLGAKTKHVKPEKKKHSKRPKKPVNATQNKKVKPAAHKKSMTPKKSIKSVKGSKPSKGKVVSKPSSKNKISSKAKNSIKKFVKKKK
jgi:hypothetical protein